MSTVMGSSIRLILAVAHRYWETLRDTTPRPQK